MIGRLTNNCLVLSGIMSFDVPDKTKKHKRDNRKTAMIVLLDDTVNYYNWFLQKRFPDMILNKPLRGPHITFINESVDDEVWNKIVSKYKNKSVTFYLDYSMLRFHLTHIWLCVESPEIENLRKEFNLGEYYFKLHLTLGYSKEGYHKNIFQKNRFYFIKYE